MLPVLTIVGRPNVGKSTLFNALTQSRAAIVADMPGVTRDRQYGEANYAGHHFIVVDTGGLAELDDPQMAQHTDIQTAQAIAEADYLLFVVDGQVGLSHADREIAERLRRDAKDKTFLLVNKVDRLASEIAVSEFHELGLGEPLAIAAKSGRGIPEVLQRALPEVSEPTPDLVEETHPDELTVAIVGRPNVGKSTLINRMLGEERVVVLDRPGTTRDSIFIPFTRQQQDYVLVDTAGVRRRSRVKEAVEKFSFIKTLQAIERSQVIIVLLNAREGVNDQDLRLINLVMTQGKAIVLAFNKWDGMSEEAREQFKCDIDRRLNFLDFARRYFISALHGTGVGKLFSAIEESYSALQQEFATNRLTQILQDAVKQHQPPLASGRRIKLRMAHIGGRNPLRIVIHGKQTDALPQAYQRYLVNLFRQHLGLVGVPILLNLKSDHNPYVKD